MINTATIQQTNDLQASFLKNMKNPVPSYVIGPKKHFKFVSWVIDESLDSNLKLVNDITTLPNERSSLESFEQYKTRQQMQRLMMKYRYMFTTDISTSNGN
jgi:hypothetical protein